MINATDEGTYQICAWSIIALFTNGRRWGNGSRWLSIHIFVYVGCCLMIEMEINEINMECSLSILFSKYIHFTRPRHVLCNIYKILNS